jgi:hypothetical protein
MNPEFPLDTVLVDAPWNLEQWIVISPRVRDFLQARDVGHVEYLPVKIIDHRGRVASRDYTIAHPVGPVDCIDMKKSKFVWDPEMDEMESLRRVVLREDRIPSDRHLFRLAKFYQPVVVRRHLAQALDAEGFTGIRWTELNKYRA